MPKLFLHLTDRSDACIVDNTLCETCRFHRFPIAIGTAEAIYVLFLDKKNQN
jgi:hypothetical protein